MILRGQELREVEVRRVLFDGTNGISVNHRTRLRDQERALVASDREKDLIGERTFSHTADVAEAHRQVPIDPRDCQVHTGGDVFINTVGTFGVASASYDW